MGIAGTIVAAIGEGAMAIVPSEAAHQKIARAVNLLPDERTAQPTKPPATATIKPTPNPPVAVNPLTDERQPKVVPPRARFGARISLLQRTSLHRAPDGSDRSENTERLSLPISRRNRNI